MRELFRILLPLLLWLASFSAIYGLHGIGCAFDWTDVTLPALSLFRWALLAAWAGAILLQLLLLRAAAKPRSAPPRGFYRWVRLATAWTGLVATLWTLSPIALSTSCG